MYDDDEDDCCALLLPLLPAVDLAVEMPAWGALDEYAGFGPQLLLPLAVAFGLVPPTLWRVAGPGVETPPLRDVLALELTHEPVVAADVAPVKRNGMQLVWL